MVAQSLMLISVVLSAIVEGWNMNKKSRKKRRKTLIQDKGNIYRVELIQLAQKIRKIKSRIEKSLIIFQVRHLF